MRSMSKIAGISTRDELVLVFTEKCKVSFYFLSGKVQKNKLFFSHFSLILFRSAR